MNASYQEFKPSAALQPFVNYYWLHHFETNGQQESPVPALFTIRYTGNHYAYGRQPLLYAA